MSKIKTLSIDRKIDCEHLLGTFLSEQNYDVLINEDCDAYGPRGLTDKDGEHNALFKFRKNFIDPKLQKEAYESMVQAAGRTENRGLASGITDGTIADDNSREWVTNYQQELMDEILDSEEITVVETEPPIKRVQKKWKIEDRNQVGGPGGKNIVWMATKTSKDKFNFDSFVDELQNLPLRQQKEKVREIAAKYLGKTSYGLAVNSGIAGFFDRYPRIPWARACAYNEKFPDRFDQANGFFRRISEGFEKLMPERYSAQMRQIKKLDPKFVVPGTAFTTITINKNFRTAAHRDAGDLTQGFSNLIVVGNGIKYDGGYLILPEYRVAVNVRPGDLLLINNHEAIHGNTELIGEEGFERVSFVCYFREKMLEAGSWDYEQARRAFIEGRAKNESHKEWRERWNGVSTGCFESTEWYEFLEKKLGKKVLHKYHPSTNKLDIEDALFG